jgi:predicted SAM-dependent methyltransferase
VLNLNAIQQPDTVMPVEAATMKKLDLACGNNKAEGFIGVDIAKTDAVDVVHDLRVAPWPFEDDSIDEARASHFLEHLGPEERIVFMNELYRVLKKGSGCLFHTPRGFDRQVQDFSHKWPPVVESSYYYYSKKFYEDNNMMHYIEMYGIKCNFEVRPVQVSVTPDFAMRSDEHKMFATRNYTNVAVDLTVLMVKL